MPRVTIASLEADLTIQRAHMETMSSKLAAAGEKIALLTADNARLGQDAAKVSELRSQLSDLAKQLESTKRQETYYTNQYNERHREHEQLHMILDAIEGAPSRYAPPDPNGYSTRGDERALATRLAGTFLALARATLKG